MQMGMAGREGNLLKDTREENGRLIDVELI